MKDNSDVAAAIRTITIALASDPDYWQSWKANIAVQFQDEFARTHLHRGVHEISNKAADNFLKLLCHPLNTRG